MKFTLSWLKEHLDTDAPLAALVDRLTMIGLEVESVTDKAAALGAVHHRPGDLGGTASQCRPPARLHRRHRHRRSRSGRVRRAQCAHRHDERVLCARHLHPRQEHDARHRHHPRRREPGHVVLAVRAADIGRSRRHLRPAGRCAAGRALCRMGPSRRSRHRDQPDAQPAGLHRRPRHRPRPRRCRYGHPEGRSHNAGEGRRSLSGHGQAGFRGDAASVPRLRAAPGARREERPEPGMAAAAARRDRAAADQCAGRYHQFHYLRPGPAAACVRCRQGSG